MKKVFISVLLLVLVITIFSGFTARGALSDFLGDLITIETPSPDGVQRAIDGWFENSDELPDKIEGWLNDVVDVVDGM